MKKKGLLQMDNQTRRDKGMAYITDDAVWNEMLGVRKLVQQYNTMDVCDLKGLQNLISKIFGKVGKNCCVNPPFHCDYGKHISVGDNFFANYNCTILDVAKVK